MITINASMSQAKLFIFIKQTDLDILIIATLCKDCCVQQINIICAYIFEIYGSFS